MSKSNKLLVRPAIALALAVSSTSTFAQESLTLEEVVITAQKRAESVQTAALSINAVAGDELLRSGVKDFTTISKVAPELSVNPGAAGTVIAVRGVRSNAFGPTDESNNAIHMDGVYLARFLGLTGMFYDIQRLEVASGPQGTLYGRNATGGAVNIISNKPTHEFGGRASLEGGNYNLISAEGALNVPLNDQFAVRIAARHYKHDGYYEDTGLDDADQNSGRLSALWNINDAQSLLVTADIATSGGKGGGSNIVAEGPLAFTPVNQSDGSPGLSGAPGTVPAVNGHYVSSPVVVLPSDPRRNQAIAGNADQNKVHIRIRGIMAQYDHDLGFATLTSQASWRDLDSNFVIGTLTGNIQPAYELPGAYNVQQSSWRSAEVRLASNATTPLKWVTGLYWFTEHLTDAKNVAYITNNTQNSSGPRPVNPFTIADPDNRTTNNPTTRGHVSEDSTTLAYAAFAEATWSPIDPLHLTGGVRYNSDEKTWVGPMNFTTNPPTIPAELEEKWSKVTWRVNVAYDLAPSNFVYANIAKGYKSGGFAFGPRPKFDPETIIAYEVGSKNQFFNNRLRLNAAAWFYDYKDYETAVPLCVNETPVVCNNPLAPNNAAIGVINAGGAQTYGASLNAEVLLFEADRLSANLQWLDAKYVDFDLRTVAYVAPSSRRDFTKTKVGYAAEWSGSASYTHVWNLGSAGTLDAQLAVQYASERLLANQAQPGTPQNVFSDPATTADFSLRYGSASKIWDVTAYVNNLTDELVSVNHNFVNSVYNAAVPTNTNTSYFNRIYGPPRTYGVILGARF